MHTHKQMLSRFDKVTDIKSVYNHFCSWNTHTHKHKSPQTHAYAIT